MDTVIFSLELLSLPVGCQELQPGVGVAAGNEAACGVVGRLVAGCGVATAVSGAVVVISSSSCNSTRPGGRIGWFLSSAGFPASTQSEYVLSLSLSSLEVLYLDLSTGWMPVALKPATTLSGDKPVSHTEDTMSTKRSLRRCSRPPVL